MHRASALLLLAVLYPASAPAASCPNVSIHPGVSTIFLQTDFGEKDAASKAYVAGFQEAIKKSTAYCVVEDPRAALFALNLAGIDIAEDHERAALSLVIISEKGTLIVATEARVDAEIEVGVVVISGRVNGNVIGHERVELSPGAVIMGNISTNSLAVKPGAFFHGDCCVWKNEHGDK